MLRGGEARETATDVYTHFIARQESDGTPDRPGGFAPQLARIKIKSLLWMANHFALPDRVDTTLAEKADEIRAELWAGNLVRIGAGVVVPITSATFAELVPWGDPGA